MSDESVHNPTDHHTPNGDEPGCQPGGHAPEHEQAAAPRQGDDVLDLLSGLESRLDELKRFHAEKVVVEARLREQAEALDARSAELDGTRSELEARGEELDRTRSQLDAARDEVASAREAIDQQRASVEADLSALADEQAAFGDAVRRATEAEARVEQLEGRVSELESEINTLREQHEQVRAGVAERVEHLVSEIAKVEEQRDAERDAREQQADASAQREREMDEALGSARENASARDREVESLRNALQEAAQRAARTEEQTIEALSEAEAQRDTARADAEILEKKLDDLTGRLDEVGSTSASQQGELDALRREVEEKREIAERAQAELAELREAAASEAARATSLELTVSETTERAEAEASELRSAADAARAEGGSLRAEIETLRNQIETLEVDLATARDVAEGVSASSEDRDRAVAALKQELEATAARENELAARVETLQGELGEALEAATRAATQAESDAERAQKNAVETPSESAAIEALADPEPAPVDTGRITQLDEALAEAEAAREAAESRVAKLEAAVTELSAGRNRAGEAASHDEVFISRRRGRLKRQRLLLAAQSRKLRKASVALRQKFEESERLLSKRAEVHAAARAVAEAQKSVKRKRATLTAVWSVAGIVATLALLAGLSLGIAKQVVPGQFLASSTIAADAQARIIEGGEYYGWSEYMGELFSDARFHQELAGRMARRGMADLASGPAVADRLEADLVVTETSEGELRVEMIGEGAARAERELETVVATAASFANGSRQSRPDGLLTVVTEPPKASDTAVDNGRIVHALILFGGGSTLCLLVGIVVWRRMVAAKAAFEREVLAAASSEFVTDM